MLQTGQIGGQTVIAGVCVVAGVLVAGRARSVRIGRVESTLVNEGEHWINEHVMQQAVLAACVQSRYAGDHQIKTIDKDGWIECDHYIVLHRPERAQVLGNCKGKGRKGSGEWVEESG